MDVNYNLRIPLIPEEDPNLDEDSDSRNYLAGRIYHIDMKFR